MIKSSRGSCKRGFPRQLHQRIVVQPRKCGIRVHNGASAPWSLTCDATRAHGVRPPVVALVAFEGSQTQSIAEQEGPFLSSPRLTPTRSRLPCSKVPGRLGFRSAPIPQSKGEPTYEHSAATWYTHGCRCLRPNLLRSIQGNRRCSQFPPGIFHLQR